VNISAVQPRPLAWRPAQASPVTSDEPKDEAKFSQREMWARYSNNVLLHLVISDAPSALSLVANLTPLPAGFGPVLDFFNSINALTSVAAGVADLRETRATFKNPHATKLDKIMDVSHLIGSDALSAVAAMVPVFCSLNNPAAMALFVGGQVFGIAFDVVKTGYDFHRKGQQSAPG
jgi:hypothetical protein